jgi:hypothetical protein
MATGRPAPRRSAARQQAGSEDPNRRYLNSMIVAMVPSSFVGVVAVVVGQSSAAIFGCALLGVIAGLALRLAAEMGPRRPDGRPIRWTHIPVCAMAAVAIPLQYVDAASPAGRWPIAALAATALLVAFVRLPSRTDRQQPLPGPDQGA